MFSKPKTTDTTHSPSTSTSPSSSTSTTTAPSLASTAGDKPATPRPAETPRTDASLPDRNDKPSVPAKAKPQPSLLSADLMIQGNVMTEGDIQVEGTIEGDVRANLLTVGETAVIRGEIAGDDVIVHGHVVGRVRGVKVRLTSTAEVEGDIVHKTIAIESGAHFEGSVQRSDNPLGGQGSQSKISSIKDAKTTAAE